MSLKLPQTKIKQITSIIPSPMGNVSVKWNRTLDKNKSLQLVVPKGMEIKLDIESFKIPQGKSLKINRKKIRMAPFYKIPSVKWEVVF